MEGRLVSFCFRVKVDLTSIPSSQLYKANGCQEDRSYLEGQAGVIGRFVQWRAGKPDF